MYLDISVYAYTWTYLSPRVADLVPINSAIAPVSRVGLTKILGDAADRVLQTLAWSLKNGKCFHYQRTALQNHHVLHSVPKQYIGNDRLRKTYTTVAIRKRAKMNIGDAQVILPYSVSVPWII